MKTLIADNCPIPTWLRAEEVITWRYRTGGCSRQQLSDTISALMGEYQTKYIPITSLKKYYPWDTKFCDCSTEVLPVLSTAVIGDNCPIVPWLVASRSNTEEIQDTSSAPHAGWAQNTTLTPKCLLCALLFSFIYLKVLLCISRTSFNSDPPKCIEILGKRTKTESDNITEVHHKHFDWSWYCTLFGNR